MLFDLISDDLIGMQSTRSSHMEMSVKAFEELTNKVKKHVKASGRPSDYISDIKEFHWHSSQQPEQPAVLHPSVTGRVGSEAEP